MQSHNKLKNKNLREITHLSLATLKPVKTHKKSDLGN